MGCRGGNYSTARHSIRSMVAEHAFGHLDKAEVPGSSSLNSRTNHLARNPLQADLSPLSPEGPVDSPGAGSRVARTPGVPPSCNAGGSRRCGACISGVTCARKVRSCPFAMRRSGVRIPSAPLEKPGLTCGNADQSRFRRVTGCTPCVPLQRMQRAVRRSSMPGIGQRSRAGGRTRRHPLPALHRSLLTGFETVAAPARSPAGRSQEAGGGVS